MEGRNVTCQETGDASQAVATLSRSREAGSSGVEEPGRQDFPLGKLSTEWRAAGIWMVRGTTEMAKKVSFKDSSGDMYGSLPLLNICNVTSFIKWLFFLAHIPIECYS